MAYKPETKEDQNKVPTVTAASSAGKDSVDNSKKDQKSSGSYLAETEQTQTKKKNILQELFVNGNKLLTLPN